MQTTAERLGYPSDARLLIINGDDIGMCHAANLANVDGLKNGILTSMSLMVPCPWALEAVDLASGLDVGVHLTVTAEWRTYRWGPMTALGRDPRNGLVDPEGYFWHGSAPVADQANAEAVLGESRVQIDWALARGVDVTGLDNHMGVYSSRPDLLSLYVELARTYRLPLRLGSGHRFRERGHPELAELADAAHAEGITLIGYRALRDAQRAGA